MVFFFFFFVISLTIVCINLGNDSSCVVKIKLDVSFVFRCGGLLLVNKYVHGFDSVEKIEPN